MGFVLTLLLVIPLLVFSTAAIVFIFFGSIYKEQRALFDTVMRKYKVLIEELSHIEAPGEDCKHCEHKAESEDWKAPEADKHYLDCPYMRIIFAIEKSNRA